MRRCIKVILVLQGEFVKRYDKLLNMDSNPGWKLMDQSCKVVPVLVYIITVAKALICFFLLKATFQKQKDLILIGERVLLSTIRFDFNVLHPYKPLLEALKKLGITQREVRQTAWNLVNDWYATSYYLNSCYLFICVVVVVSLLLIICIGFGQHFTCNISPTI